MHRTTSMYVKHIKFEELKLFRLGVRWLHLDPSSKQSQRPVVHCPATTSVLCIVCGGSPMEDLTASQLY